MPDSRFSTASAVQDATQTDMEVAQLPAATGTVSEGKYFARSPRGTHVEIPKELFIALSDFLATRRYPGAINIQFHGGMIVCIEAVAKKTYR